jgi:hypothetical protein
MSAGSSMRRRSVGPTMAAWLFALWAMAQPSAAVAQTADAPAEVPNRHLSSGPLSSSASDLRRVGAASTNSATRRQSRRKDSLANGAIVGAIAGGLALGVFGGVICKVQQEEGGGSCVPDFLRITAIGAGIGAGVGIGIDAALARGHGVTVGVRARF